uniref:Uncharacterized protein n=1 Tax=Oryza glaberrima TaxID=4538 RepID=I1Q5X7_ORYGL
TAAATELSPPLQVVVALPKVTAAIIPTSSSGGAPQLVDARSDSRTGDLDEAGRSGSLRGCYRAGGQGSSMTQCRHVGARPPSPCRW